MPDASPAPREAAPGPAEQVVRPPEGLARGLWEAPAAAFYGAAGALFVTSCLYAARRAGLLPWQKGKKAGRGASS